MNAIFVLITGIPLAAAIAIATSLPILFVLGFALVWGLWLSAGREQQAYRA